jgi:hypothetical protein
MPDFVFAYHMRMPTDAQMADGTRQLAVFVWKTTELDEHGAPTVSPCFTVQLTVTNALICELNLIELNDYIGAQTTRHMNDAMEQGSGHPLYDRIMQVRVPTE